MRWLLAVVVVVSGGDGWRALKRNLNRLLARACELGRERD